VQPISSPLISYINNVFVVVVNGHTIEGFRNAKKKKKVFWKSIQCKLEHSFPLFLHSSENYYACYNVHGKLQLCGFCWPTFGQFQFSFRYAVGNANNVWGMTWGSLVQAQPARSGARGKRVSGMWLKLHIFHRHQSTGCFANLINQMQRHCYVHTLDWPVLVLLPCLWLLLLFRQLRTWNKLHVTESEVRLLFDCFTPRHGHSDTCGLERNDM
jgi:hypothetical protein